MMCPEKNPIKYQFNPKTAGGQFETPWGFSKNMFFGERVK